MLSFFFFISFFSRTYFSEDVFVEEKKKKKLYEEKTLGVRLSLGPRTPRPSSPDLGAVSLTCGNI